MLNSNNIENTITIDGLDPIDYQANRKVEIMYIFEEAFIELWFKEPHISDLRRWLVYEDGSVSSIDFFSAVHSEMPITDGKNVSHRAVIANVNGEDILIVHEARSSEELPNMNNQGFYKILTGLDIFQTWKVEKFQSFFSDIVKIESEMRKRSWKVRGWRDTSSLDRVNNILNWNTGFAQAAE